MNTIQNIIDERSYTVQLIRGYYGLLEKPYYAFIAFRKSALGIVDINNLNSLEENGLVLLKGEGHVVPDNAAQLALYLLQHH